MSVQITPLPGATFGGLVQGGDASAEAFAALPDTLTENSGFLLVPDMHAISDDPTLLVRLSRLFGPEVEDYRLTGAAANTVHTDVPEIMIVSNARPVNHLPPAPPDPARTADGGLPVQFPHRRGWHTDQSYRRPPPDISLFYAVTPAPEGQGQTLYADGAGAYVALPGDLKERIKGVDGLHVKPRTGRSEHAVRAGDTPQPLAPHQRPQRQPLVRTHPVSGQPTLYLCEAGQMDWVEGPIVGMEPGIHGDGAKLVYELMTHMTGPDFTYAHHWKAGDLVIYDNRAVLHSATWFDAEAHTRVMWRTTVHGNPGPEYADESKSWIPAERSAMS